MKMEAMTAYTEDEIKAKLQFIESIKFPHWYEAEIRLILSWATAKAEAEILEHDRLVNRPSLPASRHQKCSMCDCNQGDWLAAVLQRIGWPQDDGQNAPG